MKSNHKFLESKKSEEEYYLEIRANRIRYERNKISFVAVLANMADSHVAIGSEAYFKFRDATELKQHYHVAGLLNLLGSAMAKNGETILSRIDALYAMLSDSNKAIHACATMGSPLYIARREMPTEYQFYTHIYQLVLLEDYDKARKKIDILKYSRKKNIREESRIYVDFYESFFERDKEKLEKLILSFAMSWKKRVDGGAEMPTVLTAEVMAANAVEFAKLCWIKGVEVEIDHPFVPMDLLPIRPLPHYDDVYDFLSPEWIPPPQGKIADFKRWIKKIIGYYNQI